MSVNDTERRPGDSDLPTLSKDFSLYEVTGDHSKPMDDEHIKTPPPMPPVGRWRAWLVVCGVSCGICFGPTIGLVGHWFQKNRGLPLAITALGSSFGGTLIPIVARQLIPRVGFQWTMRILGFILACTLGVSNLTLKRRLPPKNVPGGLLNLKALKNPAFAVYCISTTVAFLGMYTLLTFIDVSAVAIGIPESFSFYLVSIANAGSGAGRLTCGLIVDKTGPVNIIVPMTVAAATITYLWPMAQTKDSLIAVAVVYGFTSAAYVATFQMPLYELGDIEDVGRRAGMVMTFAAFGAVAGPPISGAISRTSGGFSAVGYYAGEPLISSYIVTNILTRIYYRKYDFVILYIDDDNASSGSGQILGQILTI
ncbi:hypothetical protein H0H81_006382 [Sphagnurus paluster]|uniref:Uncharacterized protein n=1 Tax=Sphagnurus paluster TaxID=117069 RepID=A0A9P7K5H3_9AGAR|nr:hypothetical protein H0H81_006382 [Sphagnurus paluster]